MAKDVRHARASAGTAVRSSHRRRNARVSRHGGLESAEQTADEGWAAGPELRRITVLPVSGLFCHKCVSRVRAALLAVPGVTRVVVDLSRKGVSPVLVEYQWRTRDQVRRAVARAGFVVYP